MHLLILRLGQKPWAIEKQFLTETAYAMPTFDKGAKTVKHAVVVSEDLYNNLKALYGDNEKSLADTLRFVILHETMHITRGDLFPWKKSSVKAKLICLLVKIC